MHITGSYVSQVAVYDEVNITVRYGSETHSNSQTEASSPRRDFSQVDGEVMSTTLGFSCNIADALLLDGDLQFSANISAQISVRWELTAVTKQCPYPYQYCPPTTHCCGWGGRYCCHRTWYGKCTGHCQDCNQQCPDACYTLIASPGNPCGTSITRSKFLVRQNEALGIILNISARSEWNETRIEEFAIPAKVVLSLPVDIGGIKGKWKMLLSASGEANMQSQMPLKPISTELKVLKNDIIGSEYVNGYFYPIAQVSQPSFQDTRTTLPPEPNSSSSVSITIHPISKWTFEDETFRWDQIYHQAFNLQVQ
jgi:hypothetical protein